MKNEFVQKFTQAAYAQGISNLEFYFETNVQAMVNVHEEKIWERRQSTVTACYVQGEYNGYAGAIFVEDFSEALFEEEIHFLKMVAEMKQVPFQPMKLREVRHPKQVLKEEMHQKAKELLNAEQIVLGHYKNLKRISDCHFEERVREILIQNAEGVCMQESASHVSLWLTATAEKDGKVQIASRSVVAPNTDDMDISRLFEEAAEEACQMLDALPVPTGSYPVILKNNIVCEMLSMYISAFGADLIHQNLSKFLGKAGQQVAATIVNIVEDPELAEGINNRTFDDEGTRTIAKILIEHGILKRFLYNQEEAKTQGCTSTGNGFKRSYKGKPEIGVTNLKLFGQDKTREDLIGEMRNGLYITHCDGMFAGADVISGDFSLISKGYLVENGKLVRGVNQITIAGNFYDMLKEINAIGNDYQLELDMKGAFLAPSVYVKELVVSGT